VSLFAAEARLINHWDKRWNELDQCRSNNEQRTVQSYIGKFPFNECLLDLIAWCDRRKPGHFFNVTCRWLFLVAEPPRVLQPPGAIQLVPENLTIPLRASNVHRELALKEFLP